MRTCFIMEKSHLYYIAIIQYYKYRVLLFYKVFSPLQIRSHLCLITLKGQENDDLNVTGKETEKSREAEGLV